MWKLHKKTPGDPVSSLFGPKPPYDRRSETAVWEGSPADARAKRPAGPEVTADSAFAPGGGTSPSLFGATASSGMAGQPPYPETRAEPNNSAAGAENPEIRRIFVRIVPASRTVVADPPCAEPAGGGVPGRRKENTNANDIWQTKKSSFRWSA